MDIVYVNKTSAGNGTDELRYSLRSLSNIDHDAVYIAGDTPDWADSVISIVVEQDGGNNDESAKQRNIAKNLMAACDDPRVSEDFIYMNDDFFIIRPITIDALNRHRGQAAEVIEYHGQRFNSDSSYFHAMERTNAELIQRGFSCPKNYELHIPFLVNKRRYRQMHHEFEKILRGSESCLSQWRTLYGNFYRIGGEEMKDVKIYDEHDVRLAHHRVPDFLSGTSESFRDTTLGRFMRDMFDAKSDYEQ